MAMHCKKWCVPRYSVAAAAAAAAAACPTQTRRSREGLPYSAPLWLCCSRGSVPLEDSQQRVVSTHAFTLRQHQHVWCSVALLIISYVQQIIAHGTDHCTWPPIVSRKSMMGSSMSGTLLFTAGRSYNILRSTMYLVLIVEGPRLIGPCREWGKNRKTTISKIENGKYSRIELTTIVITWYKVYDEDIYGTYLLFTTILPSTYHLLLRSTY